MRIAFATLTLLVLAGTVPAQEAKPAYLGVRAATLDAESRAQFPYIAKDVTAGVVLAEILPGTAAARASLKGGDVLVKLGGQTVTSFDDLRLVLSKKKSGDSIDYVVRRGAGTISGRVTLGPRPDDAEAGPRVEIVVPERPMVPPAVKKPAKRAPADDVDARLERIRKDMADLRAKALARRNSTKRPAGKPRTFRGWVLQERQRLAAARKAGDQQRIYNHEIRLALLEEMQTAQTTLPDERLIRIERKLDELLRILGEKRR